MDSTFWYILSAVLAGAGGVIAITQRAWAVVLVAAGVLCLVLPRLF